jgi:carbon-monoxide dehydrogenase large subunit
MQVDSAPPKFAIAQSPPRKQDARLLTGGGRYTDDVRLPGELFAVFARSAHAHGVLRRIETAAAAASPGVRLALTQADLEGYATLPCAMALAWPDGRPMIVPPHPPLAKGRVRYVGQPLAMVVAESFSQARDAAALVEAVIEPLPAVVDMEAALAPGAPQLFDELSDNLAVEWRWGDHAAVAEAFSRAAHVTRLRVENNRVVVLPLEPRGAVAAFEEGRFLVRTGCQGVFGLRAQLAAAMRVRPEEIRVVADDIGGSFGMKASIFPEHVPLLHAARALGRPVRWSNDRSESFLADYHGRGSIMTGELALDADGKFLAVRVEGIGDMGGYVAGFGPAIPTVVFQKNLAGPYRTPLMAIRVRCALTNTTPTTAYRGAGRPEGAYLMERLVEAAARETGRDPIALRRRNLIRREEMPFPACNGMTYDSGDPPAVLDLLLQKADWAGRDGRRAEARARGRLRGFGVCSYLEVTAPPSKEMGGLSFGADGRVTLTTGTLDYGQGHATPFAQVLADRLGLPFEKIDLVQGDSDRLLYGGGTGGSKSIMASGAAILAVAAEVERKGRALAAQALEAAEADIGFAAGRFTVAGTDRAVGILDLARDHPGALDAALVTETPPSAFPNGAHLAEVEIDPETGEVRLERYLAVDDFGTLVNPMLVEGQVHGGLAQGIGQALLERTVFDRGGQLLTGSLMDYAPPRAADLPGFELAFRPEPATTNPLGVKGCGEAGVTAAPPAVMAALLDALAPLGIFHLDMPATPERVWRAIREATGAG